MTKFCYLGNEQTNINEKAFLKIYVLDMTNKYVHTIYKLDSRQLLDKFSNIKMFEDITNIITFAIKRNGKISLDIK